MILSSTATHGASRSLLSTTLQTVLVSHHLQVALEQRSRDSPSVYDLLLCTLLQTPVSVCLYIDVRI